MNWGAREKPKVVEDMGDHVSRRPRLIMDRWDAMREVYDILRQYSEPDRRRIMEAVEAQLRDEQAAQMHGEHQ